MKLKWIIATLLAVGSCSPKPTSFVKQNWCDRHCHNKPVEISGRLVIDAIDGSRELYLRDPAIQPDRQKDHLLEWSNSLREKDIRVKFSRESRAAISGLNEDAWIGTVIWVRGIYKDNIFGKAELKQADITSDSFRKGNNLIEFRTEYESFKGVRDSKRACDAELTGKIPGFNPFVKPMTPWEGGVNASKEWIFESHVPVSNSGDVVGWYLAICKVSMNAGYPSASLTVKQEAGYFSP
jgi:hypothetical protein